MLGKLGPYHEIALSCIITLNLWGRHTRIRAGTWLIDAIISITARHVGASCVLRPPPSAFLRIFFVAACLSTTRFFSWNGLSPSSAHCGVRILHISKKGKLQSVLLSSACKNLMTALGRDNNLIFSYHIVEFMVW